MLNSVLSKTLISQFLAFYTGCLGCFLLQSTWGWSAILASSALGLLITYIPFPAHLDRKDIEIAFCTGTFAGMSSSQILHEPWHALLISLVGTVIYALAKPHFVGLGGKMGAMAFLSTCFWLMVRIFA